MFIKKICTSKNRPICPHIADCIFEIDTGKHLVYHGDVLGWKEHSEKEINNRGTKHRSYIRRNKTV